MRDDATRTKDATPIRSRDAMREPMQPPPQLVRWLKEKYPKPTIDEVRVPVSTPCDAHIDRFSFGLASTGFRNATLG
jgi:hypothetical protein